jgi:hypothetical protein
VELQIELRKRGCEAPVNAKLSGAFEREPERLLTCPQHFPQRLAAVLRRPNARLGLARLRSHRSAGLPTPERYRWEPSRARRGCSTRRTILMLCFLTARRLKPGTFDEFRKAWEPDEWPPQFVRAYHVRDLTDENMVVSFGLFDGTPEDYRQLRTDERAGEVEDLRQRKMSEFVDQTVLDGVFEVIDEVTPA